MKKVLRLGAIALASVVGLSSCMKDKDYFDAGEQLELEKPIIKAYVDSIPELEDATLDENTGIWYKVLEKGEREPEEGAPYEVQEYQNQNLIAADAVVEYEGRLVEDGTVFDKTTETEGDTLDLILDLNTGQTRHITAWMLSFLPKEIEFEEETYDYGIIFDEGLRAGDEIRIVTPSFFAYGNTQQGKVPANSPLDFTIKVLDVKKHDLNDDGDDDDDDSGDDENNE
ncbi:MAG TPA: hypothetical protein VK102_05975 [Sphingobacterium sp.]|nr:hypothetical protein [Sphingobacterium sp.]